MIEDYNYYFEKYLKTLTKMRLSPDDYSSSKFNTRTHNRAIDQYKLLKNVMEENHDLADKVYSLLMEIDDVKVQFYAAANCLKLNLHVKRAEEILERMLQSNERWAVMIADGVLNEWHSDMSGEIL